MTDGKQAPDYQGEEEWIDKSVERIDEAQEHLDEAEERLEERIPDEKSG